MGDKLGAGGAKGAARGHILALATVLLWGTTFVSTKVLLQGLSPAEVLVLRFVIAYVVLWIIRPRRIVVSSWKLELLFAAAGISGVTLSFMIENTALTLTTASNVGVINAASPLFTGLIAAYVLKEGRLSARFFLGFVLALGGIALISFSGAQGQESVAVDASAFGGDTDAAGVAGCLLALGIPLMSSIYSNISKRISLHGFDAILITRRMFFWGLVGMLPFIAVLGFDPDWSFLAQPIPLLNLVFLGLGASAACYAMWNASLKILGTVLTMTYQYLVPVISIALSVLLLGEAVTFSIVAGCALTIIGLVLSQNSTGRKA